MMKKYVLAVSLTSQIVLTANTVFAGEQPVSLLVWPSDLTNFVNKVVNNHPQNRMAASSTIRAGRQLEVLDQPIANPELELEGTNRDTDIQPDGSKPDAERSRALSLSLTTDFGVKQAIKKSIGSLDISIAKALKENIRNELSAHTILALATYHSAKEEALLANSQKQAMQRFIQQAEKLRSGGETSATDLTLGRLTLAETLRADLSAQGRLEQAIIEVQTLCQCAPSTFPMLPATLPNFREPDFDKIFRSLPATRATSTAVKKAFEELRLAKAERITNPTFRLSGGKEGKASFLTVGVSIPIPVLRTGHPEVRVAEEALIEAENADLAERAVRKRQAISSYRSYDLAQRTLSLWETQNIATIDEQSRLLDKLWKAGEIGTTEYLVKIRETIEASKIGVQLRGQAWASLASWLVSSNKLSIFLGNSHD